VKQLNNNLKWLIIIASVLTISVASAALYQEYVNPNNATVNTVTMWLEGESFLNGTTIEWGPLEPNYVYMLNLTVRNDANVNVQVIFDTIDLPTGWIQEWFGNGTILIPGAIVEGDIELTIPNGEVAGSYSWETIIMITEVS